MIYARFTSYITKVIRNFCYSCNLFLVEAPLLFQYQKYGNNLLHIALFLLYSKLLQCCCLFLFVWQNNVFEKEIFLIRVFTHNLCGLKITIYQNSIDNISIFWNCWKIHLYFQYTKLINTWTNLLFIHLEECGNTFSYVIENLKTRCNMSPSEDSLKHKESGLKEMKMCIYQVLLLEVESQLSQT